MAIPRPRKLPDPVDQGTSPGQIAPMPLAGARSCFRAQRGHTERRALGRSLHRRTCRRCDEDHARAPAATRLSGGTRGATSGSPGSCRGSTCGTAGRGTTLPQGSLGRVAASCRCSSAAVLAKRSAAARDRARVAGSPPPVTAAGLPGALTAWPPGPQVRRTWVGAARLDDGARLGRDRHPAGRSGSRDGAAVARCRPRAALRGRARRRQQQRLLLQRPKGIREARTASATERPRRAAAGVGLEHEGCAAAAAATASPRNRKPPGRP